MYYDEIEAFCKKYDNTKKEYAFCAETTAQHEEWRQRAAQRLMEISGIRRCEPAEGNARRLESFAEKGYAKEYWLLDTEPGIVTPFYLLRPDKPNGGVVLIPHGHGGGKEASVGGLLVSMAGADKEADAKAPLAEVLARDGFFVLCPDERGSGERRERFQQGDSEGARRGNSHRELLQIAIGFGQSVIGLAVWDLMRLVDFAEAIPEVRKGAVGCVGMSGGGFQTLWLAALDRRVRAAVTSGYFYGMRDSLVRMANNCACNYVPFMWETMDMGDMGAMIAPRALLVESGREDPLSGHRGLENVREQVETALKAYALYHEEDRLIHKVHSGGHVWNGEGVEEFLIRYLC